MDRILDRIDGPRDLDSLSREELDQLSLEIRDTIIRTVSQTGGHVAPNLGVVELTIALLRVFDPPRDRITWDVSHQGYVYKLLTGRRDRFQTLRQYGGLSGFLKRAESPYDAFGAGHAGTALSAALGMAAARDRAGEDHHVVAVIGDGSMGCGITLEALNNVADATERLIVVLNDNEMSIAGNVGSLSRYMGRLLANPGYNRAKRRMEDIARRLRMGVFRGAYHRVEEAMKGLVLRSVIFEEFGLRYIGPIDGHDADALCDALTIARHYEHPILVHVSTQKGRGYSYAEKQPEKWHGASRFDIDSGVALSSPTGLTYSQVFGGAMMRLAEREPRLVAITAAMPSGTGLSAFAAAHPDRFFDVGICEEHAAIFAAGLAAEGLKPVVAVYSTFMQRAVDCVIHDICLQNLPVTFCVDRAGIVGDDGPTHHGVFDIALFRPVPGLVLMQPADEAELWRMLVTALALDGPCVIRYPRGCGPGTPVPETAEPLEIGRARVVQEGQRVQLWALGDMVPLALDTAERLEAAGIKTGVVDARFIVPLDRELLARHAAGAEAVVTLENGVVEGGFGTGVGEALDTLGYRGARVRVGWPRSFVGHGRPDLLMADAGMTGEAIAARVLAALG